MHIEGGETNRICLRTSQQLLRGSPVVSKEVQLHDEMKHAFINTESNIMFSPKACVESHCLMYTHQTLYCITCILCTHVRYTTQDRSKLHCEEHTNTRGDIAHTAHMKQSDYTCTNAHCGYTLAQWHTHVKFNLEVNQIIKCQCSNDSLDQDQDMYRPIHPHVNKNRHYGR